VQVVAVDRNTNTRVTGTTPGFFTVRSWRPALGALWGDEEVRDATTACAIGETVRRTLFDEANPVGHEIRVGLMPCTIVAVLEKKGQSGFGQDNDDAVIIPISAFRAGINRPPQRRVNSIMVSASAPDVVGRTQEGITSLLRQRHRIRGDAENDFRVNNISDLTAAFDAQRSIISALLLVVASISLLVGGIVVMNIMLVSVTERTREIGIRLAIGARAADILAQFLVESVVLAAVGGAAGLGLGVVASVIVGRVTEFSVSFQPDSALFAVVVSCTIGMVFGFFPARSAARLDPIVALRRE